MLTDEQIAQTFKAMEDIYDMADGEGFIWPVDYENMRAIKAEIDRLTTKADAEGAEVVRLEAELERAKHEIDGWMKDFTLVGIEAEKHETKLKAELAELKDDSSLHQTATRLRHDADMRAIEMWHKAGGDALTWPDHADLCVWLMEQLTEVKHALSAIRALKDGAFNVLKDKQAELAEARELLEAEFVARSHHIWERRRQTWLNSHKTEQDKEG